MRIDAALLPEDKSFLESYTLPWEVIQDGSVWVLIHDFPIPKGYNHEKISIAVRMETGYPDTALDMVYVYPHLKLVNGTIINKADVEQDLDGKKWQRWSRHYQWDIQNDRLENHIYRIEEWLAKEVR